MATVTKRNPAGQGGAGHGANLRKGHTYFNAQGKPVANLQGRVLRKRVRGSKHRLRVPPAWAVDEEILRQAEQDGARTVEVEDAETGIIYTAPLQEFWAKGIEIDRGFGRQLALPMGLWVVKCGAQQLALWEVFDERQ